MHLADGRGRQRRLGSLGEGDAACRSGGSSPTCRPRRSVGCVDFRYIADALTPEEALELLRARLPGRRQRERRMRRDGYPATRPPPAGSATTTRRSTQLVREALDHGLPPREDEGRRRPRADDIAAPPCIRSRVSATGGTLMMDANQVWDVDEAIAAMRELAAFDPWWIEEPTSPDDVLGHARIREAVAPIAGRDRRARAEPRHLQAAAPGRRDRRLPDRRVPASAASTRCIAILLLAAKFGVPVCPHAGGVGLCEYVQHLRCVRLPRASAGRWTDRVVEWVDHLHEHFVHPARSSTGRYLLPEAPGYSIEMLPSSLEEYAFPNGPAWAPRGRWSAADDRWSPRSEEHQRTVPASVARIDTLPRSCRRRCSSCAPARR